MTHPGTEAEGPGNQRTRGDTVSYGVVAAPARPAEAPCASSSSGEILAGVVVLVTKITAAGHARRGPPRMIAYPIAAAAGERV